MRQRHARRTGRRLLERITIEGVCALLVAVMGACGGSDAGPAKDDGSGPGEYIHCDPSVADAASVQDGGHPEPDYFAARPGSGIAVGWGHVCAVTPSKQIKCWGNTSQPTPVFAVPGCTAKCGIVGPTLIAGIDDATGVFTDGGFYGDTARTADGRLYSLQSTKVFSLADVVGVAQGCADQCSFVVATKTAFHYAAGYPEERYLKPFATPFFSAPGYVAGGVDGVCVLSNGTITCGVHDGADSLPWTPVAGLTNVVQVSVGSVACAVLSTGRVQCASFADFQPHEIDGLTDAVQVAASGSHSCAVTATGAVLCWSNKTRLAVPVSGLPPVAELGMSSAATCARARAGTMHCWGKNGDGMLGYVGADSDVPVQVPGF